MTTALRRLAADAVVAALPQGAPLSRAEVLELLTIPPDRSLGDLAFPCFKLAKALRAAPAKIAVDLANQLAGARVFAGASAAGGYVNLRLDLGLAAATVLPELFTGLAEPVVDRRERVMVEYS